MTSSNSYYALTPRFLTCSRNFIFCTIFHFYSSLLIFRTSSAEFQITLQQSFHCLLIADLQLRLPYGKDTISVWKRTEYVRGRIHDVCEKVDSCEMVNHNNIQDNSEREEDDGDDEEDENEDEDDEEEKNTPHMTHSPTEITDAVTYISKSDLDKLRGISDSAKHTHTHTHRTSESTLKVTNCCTSTTGGVKEGKIETTSEVVTIDYKLVLLAM